MRWYPWLLLPKRWSICFPFQSLAFGESGNRVHSLMACSCHSPNSLMPVSSPRPSYVIPYRDLEAMISTKEVELVARRCSVCERRCDFYYNEKPVNIMLLAIVDDERHMFCMFHFSGAATGRGVGSGLTSSRSYFLSLRTTSSGR